MSPVAEHVFRVPIPLRWSDLAARTFFAPVEIPVGIIMALAGAPFFLYLLRREN